MDLPFDDKRDNPEGEGKPSSDIDGLWKPLAFIERLPDIFVKVYKVPSLPTFLALISSAVSPAVHRLVCTGGQRSWPYEWS